MLPNGSLFSVSAGVSAMPAPMKVGGLSVKFYDGTKEQHTKTTDYLDNLLAKYGKVV